MKAKTKKFIWQQRESNPLLSVDEAERINHYAILPQLMPAKTFKYLNYLKFVLMRRSAVSNFYVVNHNENKQMNDDGINQLLDDALL